MASGFGYNVKAIVDKGSFAEARSELAKLEQSSKKLITGIAGMAGALVASAAMAGNLAQQEIKMSQAVGMSTEAMAGWKTACNIAGVSANGLISSLTSLENKMQHLKTGSVDNNLAKNLGLMGLDYGEFAEMDSEARMRSVFNQANQMEDQQLAATLVGDILGSAGKEYYESLKLSGKSLNQQLEEAKKLNFVTDANRKQAAIFSAEIKSVKEAGKSIVQLLGSELGAALTPTVRKIKNYLIENRETIRKGISGVAQTVGTVVNAVGGFISKVTPYIKGLIDHFGGLDKIIIKVGLGFAALKLTKVVGGIKALISGVNLLKAALGGLKGVVVGGAIALLIKDLMAYASGNRSLFGYILYNLKELKKHMDEIGLSDKFMNAIDKFRKIFESEKFQKGLEKFKDFFKELGQKALDHLFESLEELADVFNAALEGDWGTVKEIIKKSIKRRWENSLPGKVVKEQTATIEYNKVIEKLKEENPYKAARPLHLYSDETQELVKQAIKKGVHKSHFQSYIDWDLSNVPEVEDGVISPGGKITQVSPDDWVFAVKNVADLAGAFLPAGVTNNTNAPASYVINQSFSVGNNARMQEVRALAYKGTSEALKQNISNATRITQFMSGTA